MTDEPASTHSATTHSVSAPEQPVTESALLLPYAESCKRVREMALRQLNRFMSYEAKVLKGDDADAIHDMRVASRRLQQMLDLLYPKPRPPELRRIRRQIRRARQALGEVRNCDVLLDHVRQSLGRKRSARREAWTAVQHFLLMRRSETFLRAMRKLGKINLAILYVNLKDLLARDAEHAHAAAHHGGADAEPNFAPFLGGTLESVWGGFRDLIADSHRHHDGRVIHSARIATKRLRYLLEVFHEFEVPGSAQAVAWLRTLQTLLGEWHDLEVLEEMMIEMLARPEFLREHLPLAMEVEKLILRGRETKAAYVEKYAHMSLESGEMSRLKEWVDYFVASPSAAWLRA